jgi:hypothetical protein
MNENTNNKREEITCDVICSSDKISPKWVLVLKSLVRVFVTYTTHIVFLYTILNYLKNPDKYDISILRELGTLEIVIIFFWFGERLIRNTGFTDFIKNYYLNFKR